MKTIRLECTWHSIEVVEVPDDYEFSGGLDDEWADQVSPVTAHLVDWEQV